MTSMTRVDFNKGNPMSICVAVSLRGMSERIWMSRTKKEAITV